MIGKTKTDLREGPEWLSFGEKRGRGRLKLDVQDKGGEKSLDLDEQSGWGVLELNNFHGRHMCIIP